MNAGINRLLFPASDSRQKALTELKQLKSVR
jgi:hypothetical protein